MYRSTLPYSTPHENPALCAVFLLWAGRRRFQSAIATGGGYASSFLRPTLETPADKLETGIIGFVGKIRF